MRVYVFANGQADFQPTRKETHNIMNKDDASDKEIDQLTGKLFNAMLRSKNLFLDIKIKKIKIKNERWHTVQHTNEYTQHTLSNNNNNNNNNNKVIAQLTRQAKHFK